jgi:hypothetical protein
MSNQRVNDGTGLSVTLLPDACRDRACAGGPTVLGRPRVCCHLISLLLLCAARIHNEQRCKMLHMSAGRAGITLTCSLVLFCYRG